MMNPSEFGGWGGIRTHERLAPLPVFKTGVFNRSTTHPSSLLTNVAGFGSGRPVGLNLLRKLACAATPLRYVVKTGVFNRSTTHPSFLPTLL
jgi:hypothetical protein